MLVSFFFLFFFISFFCFDDNTSRSQSTSERSQQGNSSTVHSGKLLPASLPDFVSAGFLTLTYSPRDGPADYGLGNFNHQSGQSHTNVFSGQYDLGDSKVKVCTFSCGSRLYQINNNNNNKKLARTLRFLEKLLFLGHQQQPSHVCLSYSMYADKT